MSRFAVEHSTKKSKTAARAFIALIVSLVTLAGAVLFSASAWADSPPVGTPIPTDAVITPQCLDGQSVAVVQVHAHPADGQQQPTIQVVVNGDWAHATTGTPDAQGIYTYTVTLPKAGNYGIQVASNGWLAGDLTFNTADLNCAPPTPDPTATIINLVATFDSAHGLVQVSGTAETSNVPDGAQVSIVFTVTGAGSPSAAPSPLSSGSFGTSFSATAGSSEQAFQVTAQVVINDKSVGNSATTHVTVPAVTGGGSPSPTPEPVKTDPPASVAPSVEPSSPAAPSPTPSVQSGYYDTGDSYRSGTPVGLIAGYGLGLIALVGIALSVGFLIRQRRAQSSQG